MGSTQIDRISVPNPVRVFATPNTVCQLTTADAWGFVEVNVPSQAVTCALPANGGPYTIIDGSDDAATYPITIQDAAGTTVGTIAANGGKATFAWDGGEMLPIPGAVPAISVAMQPVVGAPTTAEAAALLGAPGVASIAALRAATTATLGLSSTVVLGYYAGADGGGGQYWHNSSDTTSADNGGTIIVDASSRRWYLETFGAPVSVRQFGATGNGTTDDHAAFTAAGSATSGPVTIGIPAGTYLLSSSPAPAQTTTWLMQAGATFTGAGVLPGYFVNVGQFGYDPVGNAVPTNSALTTNFTTQYEAAREYTLAVGMINDKGQTQASGTGVGDKCSLYVGHVAAIGGGNGWAFNPLLTIDSGWVGTDVAGSDQNCQVIEVDINNNNVDYGDTTGGAYGNPAATGIVLTGAGKYRCTAAIQIVGSASAGSGGNTALWNYGIWIGNTSVSQYGVLDTTNASTSYGVLGTHSYGVDLQGSTCATGVRLGNAQSLSSRNGANTADLELLRLDASNNVSLGLGAAAVFVGGAGSALLPQVDNSMPLGAASNRWSVVYAVNGTIQTSDGNLKTDVQPLPAALPIVAAVNPIRFRWKSGGNVLQEVMEEQEVQETETTYEDAVRLIDGVPTLVKNAIKHERGVADYVQVRDSSGMPVTHRQRGQDVPLLHPVPRMVKKQVPVQKLVSRAGIRTHWGFIASDIKAATPEGSDWGAYVKMEDGTEGLRPDQLIPVLWKAVQELAAEIAALKASAQKTGLGGT